MSKNVLIGTMKETSTMAIESTMPFPLKDGNFEKATPTKDIRFYQNGTTITCVIQTHGISGMKGVGVAKCNENDSFNLTKGVALAELRARGDFYNKLASYHAKKA
jgi:hypothetical protein